MFKTCICLATSIFVISSFAFADDDFAKEIFKATPLTSSMWMLEGAGGNVTASVGSDGTVLVDCDFAEMGEKLISKLRELKGDSPRIIVNTHFHYDHTGGNQIFGKTATIVAASSVRDRLMTEQILWKKSHPASSHDALPILTFEESLSLHVNGDDLDVVHYPHGHTDGDTVVFFKGAKVVSLGDLYFSGMYPIFHPEHNGSIEQYLRNLDSILKRVPDGAKIVAGHGPLSGKAALVEYRDMIQMSLDAVRAGVRRKLTLKEIQKRGLPKKWEAFSHGYRTTDQWIESIYQNLLVVN